ncbi:hypothetical protein TIFTF001_002324 [Ficus carica]|uniref:H15 domain-containing protein n=1 Tax=Ficus carica TaxID=3494 RepID=A0AA88CTJ0_FICCA|nr:hypothetical protein TIFTF001_002324 [Ficus carica]
MSATVVEGEAPAVEVPPTEPAPAEEQKKKAEKPVKERKPRVPKEKKPRQPKAASHPPYFQMIEEALTALNDKSGSSPYAIAKYMEEKHKAVLPANFKKILALQLKNSVVRGKLIKIKASYKLSEAGKKDKSKTKVSTEKKPKPAKMMSQRETRATKKPEKAKKATTAAKKKKSKKSTSVKPKQPKSIKSPAAKKAKKATA